MGKFGCPCGNSISLNSIPEFNEAILITDIALDNTAGEDISADRQPHRIVYECNECGRLCVQRTPGVYEGEGCWTSFVPEGEHLKFRDDYGKGYRPRDPNPDLEDV